MYGGVPFIFLETQPFRGLSTNITGFPDQMAKLFLQTLLEDQ